jgi:hypothetical protein
VTSLCAVIWHLFSLLCITHTLPSGSSAGVAYDVSLDSVTWLNGGLPHGMGWMRWPCHGLPRGTHVGPTCQVLASDWGPLADLDQWESVTWHLAIELAQSGAAMWHCNSNWVFKFALFLIPKLHPDRSLSPSCTQRNL